MHHVYARMVNCSFDAICYKNLV